MTIEEKEIYSYIAQKLY